VTWAGEHQTGRTDRPSPRTGRHETEGTTPAAAREAGSVAQLYPPVSLARTGHLQPTRKASKTILPLIPAEGLPLNSAAEVRVQLADRRREEDVVVSVRRYAIPFLLAVAVALVACSSPDSSGRSSASAPPSESPPEVSLSIAAPVPTPVSGVTQGRSYYGVYVAVGRNDAAMKTAVHRLEAMGVGTLGSEIGEGSLACDQGAARQLGVPEGDSAVAVYFTTSSDAQAFASTLSPPPVGIAHVRTYCAD